METRFFAPSTESPVASAAPSDESSISMAIVASLRMSGTSPSRQRQSAALLMGLRRAIDVLGEPSAGVVGRVEVGEREGASERACGEQREGVGMVAVDEEVHGSAVAVAPEARGAPWAPDRASERRSPRRRRPRSVDPWVSERAPVGRSADTRHDARQPPLEPIH